MSRPAAWLLLALAILAVAGLPLMLTGTYYQFMLVIIFIYVIVSVGLNILAGYAGQFSLGHAGLFAMGAYTSALVSKKLAAIGFLGGMGLHIWIGMIAGILMASLFGAVLAYPSLRVRGPYLAMVTVAFGWVIWKILLEWVSVTGGELGITSIPKARFGSFILDTPRFYYLAMALAIGALLLQRNLVQSAFGRKMQAIKFSELAAASVGIDVHRSKVAVFILSAAFAGLGGALFAHQQNFINPDNFNFFDSVFFLLAILFGGAGTLLGPVVGAATLTLLPEFLHGFDHYRLIVYGVLILLALYFLPRGVCGAVTRGRRSVSRPSSIERRTEPAVTAMTTGVKKSDQPLLEVRGVSKAFGGVRALDGVSLNVFQGTVHALIGPNGAGKTTLLNVISGVYPPDSGKILREGEPIRMRSPDRAARLGIARTFQTVKLFGDMSVLDHVLVGFERHYETGVGGALFRSPRATRENQDKVAEALGLIEFVGLGGLEGVAANSLSYGHRRLLELARALAVRPGLLLLDEPAAGLIAEEIDALDRLIVELRSRGMTVLLVEHHMDLVMSISDQVTVLDYGVVIGEGAPREIQGNQRVIEAYLGPSHHHVVR